MKNPSHYAPLRKCYSLLSPSDPRQHVSEDHRPYICISEKCSKLFPRFSTSTQWFGHMLTHGQKWHREVYKPLSWACPLCADEDTRFSKSDDLTAHLKNFHNGTFTEPQVQAIVGQSRFQFSRSQNTCPLCCVSVNNQQNPPQQRKGNSSKESPLKRAHYEENQVYANTRIKIDTGYTQPDPNMADSRHIKTELDPKTLADQSSINGVRGEGEVMASHVAEHLQSVMLLTLRLISIDVTMEVSADSESTAGASGTAHHFSWASPSTGNPEQGIDNIDGGNDPDDDPPREDIVPDSEYTDWHHVPRRHGVNTLGKQCSLSKE